MIRMSRAGRKFLIRQMMSNPRANFKNKRWSVGRIAKSMGMKSSTYLKNIMREMVEEYDEISIEETPSGDYFHFTPYTQTSFLDRVIVINGQRASVASWIDNHV